LKNKFYSILKKVATLAQLENPKKYDSNFIKCKRNLLQFIDLAILYGFKLPSKRGRKKKDEKEYAKRNPLLFPPEPRQEDKEGVNPNPQIIERQRTNSSMLPMPNFDLIQNPFPPINVFSYYPMTMMNWNYAMGMEMNRQSDNRHPYGVPNIQKNPFYYNNGKPYKQN